MPGHDGHERRFSPEKIEKLEGEQRWRFQPAEPLVEWAAARRPSRVLDVGVGVGYFSIPLSQRLSAAHVIGLDVEPRMLDALSERLRREGLAGRIALLQAAADGGPGWDLAPGSIDLILAVNLLHELDEPGEFARRGAAALAPGGALLIVDWSPAAPAEQGPPQEHRIAESRAIEIFSEAGLALLARPPLYRDFYSLVFGFEDGP
ncbi:MAG: class I SAM-dependent methyltransferase [Myxococcales bacterium]|nr:class I SAM-dependent methyltransferase [Myxococcales bacterium]